MKIISWNVNGLRAVVEKGFADLFEFFDADCVCIQETRLQSGQFNLEFSGYLSYWNYAERKGYSGTCIYTRPRPLNVIYGIGVPEYDTEGRVLTVEFPKYYIVTVYVPNSQDRLRRLDYRLLWEDAFREFVCKLKSRKEVIICGDMNVAHEEIDLFNPDMNRYNAGFSEQERGKMSQLLDSGFVDSWRYQHPGEVKYSWWPYGLGARQLNYGWRLDYILLSDGLKEHLVSTDIMNGIAGSDHCPIELVLKEDF